MTWGFPAGFKIIRVGGVIKGVSLGAVTIQWGTDVVDVAGDIAYPQPFSAQAFVVGVTTFPTTFMANAIGGAQGLPAGAATPLTKFRTRLFDEITGAWVTPDGTGGGQYTWLAIGPT